MYGYLPPPPYQYIQKSQKVYATRLQELKLDDDATLPKEVKHYIDKSSKWNALLYVNKKEIDIVVIGCVNAKCSDQC